MSKIADRFFRFAAVVGCILLGTDSLFRCANDTTPFTVVGDFIIVLWAFGLAYWWMFNAKQDYSG